MSFDNTNYCAYKIKKRIEEIIETKNTNLVFSADMEKSDEIIKMANTLGPKLLGVKLHSDIIDDHSDKFIDEIVDLSKRHNFLIIEDRKFCDIGNTVKKQSDAICKYADLVTVHAVSGPGVIDGLRDTCIKHDCAILLIAQMSSLGALTDDFYAEQVMEMAENNADVVVGFIAQEHLLRDFYTFTPGVKLPPPGIKADHDQALSDGLKQLYNTPRDLVRENHVDVLIVGRGLYESDNPLEVADKYIYTQKQCLLEQMLENEIILHGDFTLSSGKKSDIYADFRLLMGRPNLLYRVACELVNKIDKSAQGDNVLVGVPLGALPLATMVGFASDMPMIMVRDKPKAYGRKNMIEGCTTRTKCIIIEDVITTGNSVLNTISKLEENNYSVELVLALLDRESGGVETLKNAGYKVDTLFKLSELSKHQNK